MPQTLWVLAAVEQGEVLRIRRPHDYNPTAAKALGPGEPSPHINLALLSVVGGLVDDASAPSHQCHRPAHLAGRGPGQ